MKRKAAIVFLMTSLLAGSAWAGNFGTRAAETSGFTSAEPAQSQAAPAAAPAPKAVPYSATFTLTEGAPASGVCPDGYADQCASHNCTCLEFTGTGKGTTFGTASSVNAGITVDNGDVDLDADGRCNPAFGELSIDGTKESEIVDIAGVMCDNFAPFSTTFTGGFETAEASSLIFDAEGQTATGRFVKPTELVLKLVGKACRGTLPCTD